MKMHINGVPISDYNAELQRDYYVSAAEVTSATYQGRNRSHFALVMQQYGQCRLTLPLFFTAKTHEGVALAKSTLDGQLWGVVEIGLPDGFLYRVVLESAGTITYVGEVCAEATYTFVGTRHKPLVTVDGLTVACESTVPFTDVRLDATTTAASGSLGGVAFQGLPVGQPITVDGILKRLLLDGAPYATGFTITGAFPTLTPGVNTFTAEGVEDVTISYYPTFM